MPNGTEGLNNLAPGGPGLGASPCDQGENIDIAILQVRQGQSVELRVLFCNSPFRLRVSRGKAVIFDRQNQTAEVRVPVTGLTPGDHALTWIFQAAASPWKTRSEIYVDDILEFRLKRSSDGNSSTQSVVFIQVT